MTVLELRDELARRRVNDRAYVLDGLSTGEPAEGATYLARDAGQWVIGTQERGRREDWARFDDESAACLKMLELLDSAGHRKDRPWWLRWT